MNSDALIESVSFIHADTTSKTAHPAPRFLNRSFEQNMVSSAFGDPDHLKLKCKNEQKVFNVVKDVIFMWEAECNRPQTELSNALVSVKCSSKYCFLEETPPTKASRSTKQGKRRTLMVKQREREELSKEIIDREIRFSLPSVLFSLLRWLLSIRPSVRCEGLLLKHCISAKSSFLADK